jgi:hypothetical protein
MLRAALIIAETRFEIASAAIVGSGAATAQWITLGANPG